MGLRCLLGHEYGTPELQRDREEQGGEVVVTVREVKTCTRCGEERVVSENKEITSITTPSEIEELADEGAADATVEHADDVESVGAEATSDGTAAGDDTATSETPAAADADADADAATAEADAGADAPDDGGVEFVDGSDDADPDPEPAPAGAAAAGPGAAADAPTDDGPSAEEDDGVILDDDGEPRTERGHGEWPAADDVRSDDERTPTLEEVREAADNDEGAEADAAAGDDGPERTRDDAEVVSETEHDRAQWPEQVGDDEGFAAEPDDGEPTDVSFSGLSPDRSTTVRDVTSGDAGYDAEFVGNGSNERAAGANGGQITRAAELDTSPGGGGEPTAYVCPECGLRRAAEGASLRAGDICPECRRGYITEERD